MRIYYRNNELLDKQKYFKFLKQVLIDLRVAFDWLTTL